MHHGDFQLHVRVPQAVLVDALEHVPQALRGDALLVAGRTMDALYNDAATRASVRAIGAALFGAAYDGWEAGPLPFDANFDTAVPPNLVLFGAVDGRQRPAAAARRLQRRLERAFPTWRGRVCAYFDDERRQYGARVVMPIVGDLR